MKRKNTSAFGVATLLGSMVEGGSERAPSRMPQPSQHCCTLDKLSAGQAGVIASLKNVARYVDLELRLLQMGFFEGAPIEMLRHDASSRNPLAVSIEGMMVALRREEAALIEVSGVAQ